MRQNDLTFANFVCHFGNRKLLLDEVEDIVLPTFTRDTLVRKFGDTELYFYEIKLRRLGTREGVPDLAITGRFVRNAVLKRQQIVAHGKLVEDYQELETAPSAFFVLTLADHRLLYFAETYQAPSIESFSSTIQIFMRRVWRDALKIRHDNGPTKVTYKALQNETPMPVLEIIPMARQEAIEDSIRDFSEVTTIRFKLIRPNDSPVPGSVLKSLRERYASLQGNRLNVEIGDAGGLDKDAAVAAVGEAAEDENTQIIVTGKDGFGNPAKADNHKFALSIPILDPPEADGALSKRLYEELEKQTNQGAVSRTPLTDKVKGVLSSLSGFL